MSQLIYFDHAATSWPKPPEVINEFAYACKNKGGNPGRSSHILSYRASAAIYECRKSICSLFNTKSPERVVFTYNTTYALNMAIKGLAKRNAHIVISNLEHNSVLRPVHALSSNTDNNISYSVFDATSHDENEVLQSFLNAITPNTAMAVVTIASNICGKILPVAKIGEICKKRGIIFIADGAQAAGIIPLDLQMLNIDILCIPGHKGLLGPMGTAALIASDNIDPQSIIEGGNGINSLDFQMSGELPERLEAGTLNAPCISCLCKGIQHVQNEGITDMFSNTSKIAEYCTLGLKECKNITVYGDYTIKTPVVLFCVNNVPSEQTAKELSKLNICVRGGFHCAALAHKALKTSRYGAVRASFGYKNTMSQAKEFLHCIYKMTK